MGWQCPWPARQQQHRPFIDARAGEIDANPTADRGHLGKRRWPVRARPRHERQCLCLGRQQPRSVGRPGYCRKPHCDGTPCWSPGAVRRHLSGRQSLPRPGPQRQRLGVGEQPGRPARPRRRSRIQHRESHQAPIAEWHHRHLRWRHRLICPRPKRPGVVLGIQRDRAARQWHPDFQSHPGTCCHQRGERDFWRQPLCDGQESRWKPLGLGRRSVW